MFKININVLIFTANICTVSVWDTMLPFQFCMRLVHSYSEALYEDDEFSLNNEKGDAVLYENLMSS